MQSGLILFLRFFIFIFVGIFVLKLLCKLPIFIEKYNVTVELLSPYPAEVCIEPEEPALFCIHVWSCFAYRTGTSLLITWALLC